MKKSRFSFFRKKSSPKEVKPTPAEKPKVTSKKQTRTEKRSPLERKKRLLTAEGGERRRKPT